MPAKDQTKMSDRKMDRDLVPPGDPALNEQVTKKIAQFVRTER